MSPRRHAWSSAALAALLASASAGADAPPGGDDWKYDAVVLANGNTLRGLVVEDRPDHLLVKCVTRKPGAATLVFTEWLPRAEVRRVEALDDAERERLRLRLRTLAREREALAARLKALSPFPRGSEPSGDALDLHPAPWPPDRRVPALAYGSAHFRLVSDARPAVVQLAAVQLEQVYAAYARVLPPRVASARPTTILLVRSAAEYRDLLRGRGQDLLNPAFYDAGRNEVVCLSELERLADDLEATRRHNEAQRAKLDEAEAGLRRAYGGKVPAEVRRPLEDERRRLKETEERNAAAFDRARGRLFGRLYHEAFHAYLANFVYPPADGEVPRWLNEGLAQVFETAVVEVGELRVGHADPERLAAARAALERDELPALAEVLRAEPRRFLVAHAADRPASDRLYLASWTLAFRLSFERRLLGTKALDEYVRSLGRGADPTEAFRTLVGEPLPQFEREQREYLRHLRPDGTVARRMP